MQTACPNTPYHVNSFGVHPASYPELISARELICSLSGPHSLLSKNISFVKTGPFLIFFGVRPINLGQYRLHSRCSAKTCSCMENGGGVIVKTMVRSGAGTRPLGGAAIPSDLFINTLLPPLGRRTPKGSDTSKEPCPRLRRVNSRQAGSLSACSSLSSLQSTRASEILVLVKYMWDKRMNDWVTKPAGTLCQSQPC